MILRFTSIILVATAFIVHAQELPPNAADLPISHLLVLATSALSAGQSQSALQIYEHVLSRDPTDFATLYKRATVRLALGQLSKAKEGFGEVLRIKEFDQARWQLAKLHTKLGEWEDARTEVKIFLAGPGKSGDREAKDLLSTINAASAQAILAQKSFSARPPSTDACITSTTSAINVAPNSLSLRLLRSECYLAAHNYESAAGDLSRGASLSASVAPHLLVRLSLLSALFAHRDALEIPTDATLSLKRCLSSDPDSKDCKAALRSLKAVEKDLKKLRNWLESGRWTEVALILKGQGGNAGVIEAVQGIIKTYTSPLANAPTAAAPLPMSANKAEQDSPLLSRMQSTLCRGLVQQGQVQSAAKVCEEVLKTDENDTWALVGRAEKLMADESWDEAVRVLSKAFEATGRSDRDILARLQKAQRLLKQSTAKDYYKVLGVARDADAKTIKRAYRKATLKAHPDKGGTEEKMATVNEAYEVLSKPELRQRFDNGEDPNDNTQQNPFQQGGGHPFGHFFQQGGQQFFQQGGGFHFKFGG